MTAPAPDLIGQTLAGRYVVRRLLGTGGMGTVYLAEHVHLGRPTALKVMHHELCRDAGAEARFRREALLAAKINHPSVAGVYDFDCTADRRFILAMEYVEGESVAQRLKRAGKLPLPLAADVVEKVAEGLDRAHALGILHRDLKPENIMLGRAGAVKLLDFGVARPLDTSTSVTSSGFAVGTPAYMSPEQLCGEPLDPASDLYSLGVVTYEMVSGVLPHRGETFAELRAQRMAKAPTPLHLLRPECPPGLSDVLARALDVEPKGRWASAAQFAEAFAAALRQPAARPRRSGAVVAEASRWDANFESLRLAGRGHEIGQVSDAWAAARAGRTMVLWIEGDEGAGKSAFFELAQRGAAAAGAAQLAGRGYEADVVRPYGPWLPMLRSALELGAARERAWPAISALVAPGPEEPPPHRGDLYQEVSGLLRSAAERGPIFVGMEDLDWCDPASLALVEYVAHDLSDVPALLATTTVTGRGGEAAREIRDRLRRHRGTVVVALRPLSYEAVAAWLAASLAREPADELTRFVYGHTEGNAFFIEQVMRSLLERGDLERLAQSSGRVALEDVPLPEAVAAVVRRRLKGMSPAARQILQVAAVAGREFDLDLLLAVTGRSEDEVVSAVDEAVEAGALAAVPRPTGDWYRFTHGRLGQVLAEMINARRRRKLHAELAAALLGRGDAPADVLAWHYYHAGEPAKAFDAARRAARHALAIHDYDGALTFGVMAAETAQSDAERREAHELRGDALSRLDRYAEAAAAYAHARLVGTPPPEQGLTLRRKELRCALTAGTVAGAVAAVEARRLMEGAAGLPGTLRVGVQLLLSEALLAVGDVSGAGESAQAARAAAAEAGDAALVAEAALARAAAWLAAGDLGEAKRTGREAGALFTELADPYGAARAAELRGRVAAAAHDEAGARSAFDEALRHAERVRVTRLIRQIQAERAGLEA